MKRMPCQRFSVGEELREIDGQIIAVGGGREFIGVETATSGAVPRYLFANTGPMTDHAQAVVYMQGRLQAAEMAALGED